ncbi:citrate/2-methylcitrate synthase [uncultured Georgenia sp.]|uniref:citrate/2-methylcitrate synthase n=1 Tax=uncultured Georgenia sp. TaxID=378209 RepID=UPI00260271FA|nr:citrate/2-methylcitrate synthase [uncultured Georgenia sp.]HLV04957.1 citrate/2-methylcitrate synthase [Actinomycetaceae bacterium]
METTTPIFTYGAGHEPRYRDRPVADLLDRDIESVWGLLVDGAESPALPPAEPFPLPVRTGDTRVDVQSAITQLAPVWGFRPLLDISPERAREDLARASVLTMSFVAQSARAPDLPAVPQHQVERGDSVAARFLIRWSGQAQPDHVRALDAFWTVVAEHGPQIPSTRIARIAAETGADVGACLAAAISGVSGPLAAGSVARARRLVVSVHDGLAPATAVREDLREPVPVSGVAPADLAHRVSMLRDVCHRLEVRLLAAADALEAAAREVVEGEVPARHGFALWAACLLDHLGFEPRLYNALIVCGRTAGWSAHVLEAQRELHARAGH